MMLNQCRRPLTAFNRCGRQVSGIETPVSLVAKRERVGHSLPPRSGSIVGERVCFSWSGIHTDVSSNSTPSRFGIGAMRFNWPYPSCRATYTQAVVCRLRVLAEEEISLRFWDRSKSVRKESELESEQDSEQESGYTEASLVLQKVQLA